MRSSPPFQHATSHNLCVDFMGTQFYIITGQNAAAVFMVLKGEPSNNPSMLVGYQTH